MTERGRKLVAIAAVAAICVPAIWQLFLLLFTVASRFPYPYDLEWMEGGLLDHAARIQAAQGIYTPPSIDFIPYLYTPLYPGLLAVLGAPFGLSYQLGRAIGIAALLFALGLIATAGFGERRHRPEAIAAGLLGAGLAASGYAFVEGWYDLVRGDMLFVAMAMAGTWLLGRWLVSEHPIGRGRPAQLRVAAVAATLALSFFCKQHGVLFVAAAGLNLVLWRRWRLVPVFVACAGAIGLGFSWLLQRATGGWYWTYVYEVLRGHDFNWPRFRHSFGHMLGRAPASTAVLALALVLVAARAARRRPLPLAAQRFLFWLAPLATAILVGSLGWAHQWAHFNAYVPAIFFGAAATAVALPAIAACAGFLGRPLALAAAATLAVQLLLLSWTPATFIPSRRDREAGDRLIERIASIDGEVFIPFHPWYARLAGKETYVSHMGLMDVQYAHRYQVAGLAEALRQKRFTAVILDKRPDWTIGAMRGSYREEIELDRNERPRVVTGAKVAPRAIWVPIRPPPPGVRVLFDFEDGTLEGWTPEGSAWGKRAVSRPPPHQKKMLGHRGRYWVASTHGGDAATGTLTSPPFELAGSRLTAQVGGGDSPKLRVELLVEGQVVRTARAPHAGRLESIAWNIAELAGKRATIRLVDEDTGSGGHLAADAFWLWE